MLNSSKLKISWPPLFAKQSLKLALPIHLVCAVFAVFVGGGVRVSSAGVQCGGCASERPAARCPVHRVCGRPRFVCAVVSNHLRRQNITVLEPAALGSAAPSCACDVNQIGAKD